MKRLCSRGIFLAISLLILLVISAVAQDGDTARETPDVPQRVMGAVTPVGAMVVNNPGDATDATPGNGVCETAVGNGVCTLRAAIVEANSTVASDVITFDPAITVIQVSGQLSITSNMTLSGNAPSSPVIQNIAPVSTTSRVFNITNFTVNLNRLTISGGNVTGNGGGIQNTGTLTITNCVIEGNNASAVGAGVRSTNTLIVMNSTISGNASLASTSGGVSFAGATITIGYSSIFGNSSFGNGGGLNISATASAIIFNSTIANNTAGASSGGLFLNRGNIVNSTISGNTANGALATDGGGGIRIQAGANTVAIRASTITANSAPNASAGSRSGIWHETGSLSFVNTIVAANITQDIQRDGAAQIVSDGFNLIGENTSVETAFPAGSPSGTSYVGTDAAPLDPMIAPLADNGGPTRTHALLGSSIAIDKGGPTPLLVDQRRVLRVVDLPQPNAPGGDGADIGAYEFMSTSAIGATILGQVFNSSGGNPVGRARVVLSDGEGTTITAITNPFGFYSFGSLQFGKSYVITVDHKGFSPTAVLVTPDVTTEVLIGLDPAARESVRSPGGWQKN